MSGGSRDIAFYVGQKVVCVDAKDIWVGKPTGLIVNHIYTIAGFGSPDVDNICGLVLQEVKAPLVVTEKFISSGAFSPSRFRPLVSRPTDISIFTAMLGPKQLERINNGPI